MKTDIANPNIRNSIKNQIQTYVRQEQLTEKQVEFFAQMMNRWIFDSFITTPINPETTLQKIMQEIQNYGFEVFNLNLINRISQRIPNFFPEDKAEIESTEHFQLFLEKSESFSQLFLNLYLSIYQLGQYEGDLFGQIYSDWINTHRKKHGQFYTLPVVCQYMVRTCLESRWNMWWTGFKTAIVEKKIPQIFLYLNDFYQWRVLDLACGAGAFLIAALSQFWEYYQKIDSEINSFAEIKMPPRSMERIRLIIFRHLFGMDLNRNALENTALNLVWAGIKYCPEKKICSINFSFNLGVTDILYAFKPEQLPEFGNLIREPLTSLSILHQKFIQEPESPEIWQQTKVSIKQIQTILEQKLKQENNGFSTDYLTQVEIHFWFAYFDEHGQLKPTSTRGFDFIVGNPPYERAKQITKWKSFYRKRYTTLKGACDIFIPFFERAQELLQQNGSASLITSNKYLVTDYGQNLRQFLLQQTICELTDLTEVSRLFSDAFISPLITRWQKIPPPAEHQTQIHIISKNDPTLLNRLETNSRSNQPGIKSLFRLQSQLAESNSGHINLYFEPLVDSIMKKIHENTVAFNQIVELRTGIMGFNYHAMEELMIEKSGELSLELLPPSLVQPFTINWGKKAVHLYGKTYSHPKLRFDKTKINIQTWTFFTQPKIIIRGIATRLTAAYDDKGRALLVAVHGAISKDISPSYLIGLLNSSLFNWIHRTMMYTARIPRGSLRYPISFLERLPIKIDEQRKNDVIKIVQKIEKKQTLDKNADIRTEQTELDQLIYSIYGLNLEEVQFICQKSNN